MTLTQQSEPIGFAITCSDSHNYVVLGHGLYLEHSEHPFLSNFPLHVQLSG